MHAPAFLCATAVTNFQADDEGSIPFTRSNVFHWFDCLELAAREPSRATSRQMSHEVPRRLAVNGTDHLRMISYL